MKNLLEILIGILCAVTVVYVFSSMGSQFAQAGELQVEPNTRYKAWQANVEEGCYNLSKMGYVLAAGKGDTKEQALSFAKYVNWRCLVEQHLAF